MVEKVDLRPVLRKIERYLPTPLLSPASSLYLEKQGIIKPEERKKVEIIKNFKPQVESFQQLEENWKNKESLAFLVNKFEKMNSSEGKEFKLYDEQIIALLRAVEGYENPKTRGEILEMEMSEGKSSVVMPVLVAYLSLRNPYLQVHTVNPYLVERDFAEFTKFAEFLGISDHVGKIDSTHHSYPSNDPKDPHNRIVFGLWSDFIHSSQFAFRDESLFYPAQPTVILDEIDQVVQDESVTPAIITEKIKTGDFFGQLIKGYKNYVKLEWEVLFGDADFDFENLKIGRQDYVLSSPEEFINSARSFFEAIGERKVFFMQKDPNLSKSRLKENILDDLSELTFQGVIREIIKKQTGSEPDVTLIEKTNNKFYDRKGNLKTVLPFFWWDMPDFQQALIEAYFLEKGVDYTIKEENGTWIRRPGRIFPRFFPGELEIKPLTRTTGYSAANKEFQDLIQLMLYIKEGLPLPQEISFNSTDMIPVGEFYQTVPKKIIGLTGSANSIAERLRHGYGLETTVIPSHNQSQRKISWQTFSSPEEKEDRALELLFSGEQPNSLIVVDSGQKAEALANKIKKGQNNIEIEILTSQNENEDKKLYDWISKKGEKRKVLIAAKMVGRGVDLQPDEDIKKSGFLLISLTPFGYERTLKQLSGRVGRRGEKGMVFVFVSPDDTLFDVLTSDERKKLKKAFHAKDQQTVEKIIELAWGKNEENATEAARHQHMFYQPFSQLRSLIKEKKFNNRQVTEKIKNEWNAFLEESRIVFEGLLIAGQGGPLTGGGEEKIWSSLVQGAVAEYGRKLETNPSPEKLKEPLINFLRGQIETKRKIK